MNMHKRRSVEEMAVVTVLLLAIVCFVIIVVQTISHREIEYDQAEMNGAIRHSAREIERGLK